MASSPLADLSGSKAISQSDELQLFPLKSGPKFAGSGGSFGASGIIFSGSTCDARVENDPFGCCGSYTLRNSVHAAIAGVKNDNSTVFAMKSVIDHLPCLAVGAFDANGKPREVTSDEFSKITMPLLNATEKLSPILSTDPAIGVQLRSGNSSYGFKTKMTTSKHVFVLNNPDGGHVSYSDPHYIFEYENKFASGYKDGKPSFERSHNLSVEHDGHQISNVSLSGRLKEDAREVAAAMSRGPTSRSYDINAKNGDFSASVGKTYENKVQTNRFGLGYGGTTLSHARSSNGNRTDKIAHRINKFTIEVARTRDRNNATDHSVQISVEIPLD